MYPAELGPWMEVRGDGDPVEVFLRYCAVKQLQVLCGWALGLG